jgi:PAS domain S-box-containing protein
LCDQLGYTNKVLLSLNFEDFIHADDLDRGRDLDQDIINGEISSYKTEKKYRRKDGTYFTGKVTKSAVYDQDKSALYLIAIVEDVSQQKENETKLRNSLEEKEILLSEVHHRVKNNVALMAGLLELQLMHTDNKNVAEVLEHYKTRLKTLSLIYENFSSIEKELTIDFSWYLNKQIEYLNLHYRTHSTQINYQNEIEKIELNINQAIPVGLICNELLINANHLDFNEIESPYMKISLFGAGDSITFTIQSNGTMKEDPFDLSNPESLDSRIITALTKQIEGEVSHAKKENLQTYELTFKKGTWRGAASYIHPD